MKANKLTAAALMIALPCACALAEGAGGDGMVGTAWSIVPALITIVMALATREIYSSLMCGLLVGGLLICGGDVVRTVELIIQDCLMVSFRELAGLNLFLTLLGVVVVLLGRSGGFGGFGAWMRRHVRSRKGAQLATMFVGLMVFIEDYFSCLTVGSVMCPVTDDKRISRAKLAFLVDATAAPVCIIAPISTYAAVVVGCVAHALPPDVGTSGVMLFLRMIPYNFYSLMLFLFTLAIILMGFDFGPMRRHERCALQGDLSGAGAEPEQEVQHRTDGAAYGHMLDLVVPVAAMMLLIVLSLLYVGGFFSPGSAQGDVLAALGRVNVDTGLSMGGLASLLFIAVFLILRRRMSLVGVMRSIPEGLSSMMPSMTILLLATSLKHVAAMLGCNVYVAGVLVDGAVPHALLPALIFLFSCLISFSTGTSRGAYSILLPIVLSIFPVDSELSVIGMAACLSGSVFGDHCSPISDTTILAATGAHCGHMAHVATQLPYAVAAALAALVSFAVAGLTCSPQAALAAGAVPMFLVLCAAFVMDSTNNNKRYQKSGN